MNKPICALDWQRKQIFRGRLALALVGERAGGCKNPRCGRERHCLGEHCVNVHQPRGSCPVMTGAEWRALGPGLVRVSELSRAWYRGQDAAEEAMLKRLSKAEREEFLAERERLSRETPKKRRIPYYWNVLWLKLVGEIVKVADDDIREAERQLIEKARASGCLCAIEGMQAECGKMGAVERPLP
jgi:hypothetical protein